MARLDAKPELLFRLRGVNQNDLLADIGLALPMTRKGPAAGKVLQADDVAALFGLDMGDPEAPAKTAVPLVGAPTALAAATSAPKPATRKSPPAKHQLAAKKTDAPYYRRSGEAAAIRENGPGGARLRARA